MNLNKHLEFISPSAYMKPIHIIGVGAIGSRLAELLVRLGFDNLTVYDFDTVEDANITNQLYTYPDIGELKTKALSKHLYSINPNLQLIAKDRYTDQRLEGAVFLCVDSMNLRKEIVLFNFDNQKIDLIFDIRMRLTDAQAYAADWRDGLDAERLLGTMQFDDTEDLTPVSVCGTTLSVAPVVVTIVSLQIMNFIHYLKTKELKHAIFTDLFDFTLNTLKY
jgi:molybdopterin/thiamine biosynthesis adenylyltransferase